MYAGVQFRSRLEASWAAMFDESRLNWEYEPFDLNGWIPDFRIWKKEFTDIRLLIEVKPLDFSPSYAEWSWSAHAQDEIKRAKDKVIRAGVERFCLVGNNPLFNEPLPNNAMFGMLFDFMDTSIEEYDIAHDNHFSLILGHQDVFAWDWKTARNKTQWSKYA